MFSLFDLPWPPAKPSKYRLKKIEIDYKFKILDINEILILMAEKFQKNSLTFLRGICY
jgi:hypothetical protein